MNRTVNRIILGTVTAIVPFLAVLGGLNGRSLGRAIASPTGGALVADAVEHDLGTVRAGPLLTRAFIVRNTARWPVTIVKLDSACGCLRRHITRTAIPPGETAEVELTINTLTQPAGPQTWRVSVQYQEPGQPPACLELRLTAVLEREITVTPPMLAISITDVHRGAAPAQAELTLTDSRPHPFTIRTIRTTHPGLAAQHRTVGSRTTITLTVSELLPPGLYDDFIILTTDDPAYPELRVPVRITKQAVDSVQAFPDRLELREPVALVQLRRSDRQAITIQQAKCSVQGVRLTWASGATAATLRVVVDPATAGPRGRGVIEVAVADEQPPHDDSPQPPPTRLTIPLEWTLD